MKYIYNQIKLIATVVSLILGLAETSNAQPQGVAEPGKCYARCLIQDIYEYEYYFEYFYRYTGDYPLQDGVSEISIVTNRLTKPLSKTRTKWVKKNADKNCKSANPEDCLVWCLVEIKDEEEEYSSDEPEYFFEVTDTSLVKDFKLDSVEITDRNFVSKGGFTEWREIVCEADVTNSLNQKIQQALIDNGYNIESSDADGQFGESSKAALVQYQRENGLPVGNLNIERLDALGVYYN